MLWRKANFRALYNSSSRRLGRVNLSDQHEETVRKVLDWIENTNRTENILWVHGPSYVSPIAQTVADYQRRHVPVATFFFNENLGPDDADICSEFIATIAYQLCVASARAMDCIVNCVACDPAVLSRSPYDQLEKLVVKPIEAIISEDTGIIRSHQLFMIVDGCDYLEREGTTLIVDILVETARRFPLDVRVLLFTKSSSGITERLGPVIQQGSVIEVECDTRSSSPEYSITNGPAGISFPSQVFRCGVRVQNLCTLAKHFVSWWQ